MFNGHLEMWEVWLLLVSMLGEDNQCFHTAPVYSQLVISTSGTSTSVDA